ncbi:DNA mismatch repair protein Mlh1 [Belonocnema kinseyi]|uniref:DNA mismatch repair protein Mlh1 n=1 Tax=Belonocnema kinseyi TaxID=2817044 RepID=UPI00143E0E36|nr:DNA mismatch repair protein Mlh1 [Belonocnema kinseyi]
MIAPSKIKKLDEVVVNRIAAGEVIQRPANALKELIENSLDAKASNIQVIVKEGGLKLLQIQDNGTGIRKDDMGIVCERFTTSKLEKFEDLQAIATFGFRGEALASISHVAQLTITTKTIDEKCAYKASYSDGKLKAPPVSCAGNQGTTISVENLFYNIPTRKKALCSASEEFSKIAEVITRYAVHNPSVGFGLKKQGETKTHVRTPHSSTKTNNIRVLYGNPVARELLEIDLKDDKHNFKLHALITNPNYSNKRMTLLLFINHRLVDSSMIKKMIEDLYSVHLPKKTHPWCYLSLEIDPANVDVNVHPTKHEVRFLHEDSIIEKVKIALDEKLSGVNASRTFYMQSKLPNVDVTKEVLKEVLPEYDTKQTDKTKKLYAHEMVRTSSTDQKLDKFSFTINPALRENKTSSEEAKENKSKDDKVEDDSRNSKNETAENASQKNQPIAEEKNESTSLAKSKISDNSVVEADNSTCFMLSDSDESDVEKEKNNQSIDIEIVAESTMTADRALKNIYKRWGSGENDEISPKNIENEETDKELREKSMTNSDESLNESPVKGTQLTEFKSYSVNDFRREVKLKSVLMLRKEVEDNYHAGLREILSNLTFVGCIDERFSLVQSGVNLYICNTQKLAEELFYEIMLYDFANYGVIKFSEPLPLYDLAMLGLETKEAGWTEEDGTKEELAKSVQERLSEKMDMLKEYFSIVIDKKGNLKSLPILLDKYFPREGGLPLYILSLSTQVDWEAEKPCFKGICRETAKFYSQIDSDSETFDWKHVTEHILYSAIKESLLPPKEFAHDSTILEIASLPDLYKVFERC